jgi:hypothetical protein
MKMTDDTVKGRKKQRKEGNQKKNNRVIPPCSRI